MVKREQGDRSMKTVLISRAVVGSRYQSHPYNQGKLSFIFLESIKQASKQAYLAYKSIGIHFLEKLCIQKLRNQKGLTENENDNQGK